MKKSHSTWFDWAEKEAERALAALPTVSATSQRHGCAVRGDACARADGPPRSSCRPAGIRLAG